MLTCFARAIDSAFAEQYGTVTEPQARADKWLNISRYAALIFTVTAIAYAVSFARRNG